MQKPDTPTGTPPSTEDRATPTRLERDAAGNPPPSPDVDRDKAKTVTEREDALDDALDDTFPASDPPSTTPQPPAKPKP